LAFTRKKKKKKERKKRRELEIVIVNQRFQELYPLFAHDLYRHPVFGFWLAKMKEPYTRIIVYRIDS
jgi:hypothetical protein